MVKSLMSLNTKRCTKIQIFVQRFLLQDKNLVLGDRRDTVLYCVKKRIPIDSMCAERLDFLPKNKQNIVTLLLLLF